MSKTVVVGAFAHETNTFVPDAVTRADFQAREEHLYDEVPENMRGTETAVGGVIDVADQEEINLIHTVSAFATPGGVVDDDTYEFYTDLILDAVRDNVDELDGVMLPLHGAMVTDSDSDGEGRLIQAVRDVVGETVPIVVTLDLHGNVSKKMVEAADALVAYETYPHLDKAKTGKRGMRLLLKAIEGDIRPSMHMERPPVIAYQPKAYTPSGPMAEVMTRARQLEQRPGVLKVNVLPGFYHADIPEMGFTIPVVTDDDSDTAQDVSRELAEFVWAKREEFVEEYPKPPEAIRTAKELQAEKDPKDGPIVMADFGSNPGGGGASDGTTVLREILDQGIENAGWAIMHDPEAVEKCLDAGVGSRVITDIGGKTDDNHGETIKNVDGYVKAITDGRYVNTGTSHSGKGVQNDIGTTVRFQCGTDDSVTVVLAPTRASAFDAEIWRHIGQPPERLDMICIPSLIAFLGDYEPMSSEVILIDTPGTSAVNPARFDYERIPRPLFPLDSLADDAYPNWE